ncbi:1-deoxy-D-xylulose-5-phosphate reductoisomerase [Saccharospirillum salsuginis]|uniref:1-deoxy-D-xylulose 5-phosphate reductoisomerase n=1 Tax=Saccharospirillum salsuginis TaxID=418750 RepID=A0A918KHP1_9GAMM|nr:1-deoxy-D-xylulose-5-phosphate reductoisomerase [Saccharospirillum salsuginis]GGX61551.1 1-deoxy-D-xylulose 5-phosphate reductoisomerase [Saccharospirillum salsuginis]
MTDHTDVLRQTVSVLGATGSVGCNTLDVIERHPDRFDLFAISGHRNLDRLAEQALRFRPRYVVVPDDTGRTQLLERLSGQGTEILVGEAALADVAAHPDVDTVMAAIVGSAGLSSSLAAARAGKRLLLANKESLVVAGHLLMAAVAESGAELLPIDSEHNAIFQCMPSDHRRQGIASVLLTASGGPLRDMSAGQLAGVTPEQAVAHPNWSMGRKISVDSASLMNKGLELIEACWLFDLTPDQIEVVIHPQSVIHSMVRYLDGSVIAQMGTPDMRTPIAYGLAYPDRIVSGAEPLAFDPTLQLTFDTPDRDRFPCLRLAEEAIADGGTLPAVLNAANEITVAAFLDRRLSFPDIARINEAVMNQMGAEPVQSVEQLLSVDARARALADQALEEPRT